MFGGGGSVVLDAHGAITGPGGQSVFGDYLAFHYYDGSNQAIPYFPTLGIQKVDWADGWPVFNQNVETPSILKQPKAAGAGQHRYLQGHRGWHARSGSRMGNFERRRCKLAAGGPPARDEADG